MKTCVGQLIKKNILKKFDKMVQHIIIIYLQIFVRYMLEIF